MSYIYNCVLSTPSTQHMCTIQIWFHPPIAIIKSFPNENDEPSAMQSHCMHLAEDLKNVCKIKKESDRIMGERWPCRGGPVLKDKARPGGHITCASDGCRRLSFLLRSKALVYASYHWHTSSSKHMQRPHSDWVITKALRQSYSIANWGCLDF